MNAPPPYGQPQPPGYPQQPGYPQPPGYPPPPGYPQQGGPPPKKGMSGCLIAALVVAGLFVVGAIVVGLIAWRVATSDEGKKLVNAVSSGAQLAVEAQSAPGTPELHALGCQQAAVMDAQKLEEIAAQFGDAGIHATGPHILVTCTANGGKAPTCDQVASTYVKAVGRAAAPFEATVSVNGEPKESCSAAYDVAGRRTGR